ncbi:hypothetical protein [Paenibacillus spongiae]|uniref:DUF6199 domain-containing protein n=1 Tax=Paenibacillus spongiae TaxID=2909671 RepID=A0ABY5SHH7_9BACL|nr:hypothetical protein [Paenibacillus spongiae]UVI33456.1 hypothetical protein L1F29_17140 [Paenibacillus spongiae]
METHFTNIFKAMKWIAIIILAVLLLIWAVRYYSIQVFYLDNTKYTKQSEMGNIITYRAFGGGVSVPVSVTSYEDRKEVMIKSDIYTIRSMQGKGNSNLSITYPSGKTYTAEQFSGMFMVYDEQGEWVSPVSMYMNDKRILSPGEEYYSANDLIRAAYEEQHTTNGSVLYFILAIPLFVYGWCAFRFELFQRFIFKLSYGLNVENPEPTDFYLFMAKVGACLVMAASVLLFFKSL